MAQEPGMTAAEVAAAEALWKHALAYRSARLERDSVGMMTLGQMADANQRIVNCAAEYIAALEQQNADLRAEIARRDEPM